MRLVTRRGLIRLGVLVLVVLLLTLLSWSCTMRMPGSSYSGELPDLSETEGRLRDTLRHDVERLAGTIGTRNVETHGALASAADWIEKEFARAGYDVERQSYSAGKKKCENLIVEIPGGEEIVVVGGHYDSVLFCPGANDNASGTAATLALARRFAGTRPGRTLRFVAFVNEEPPWFQTPSMGSWVYAKRCRERQEKIVAMLSVETIGCYSDEKGSQQYPAPLNLFYPSTGNFIAFVGNLSSGSLVRESIGTFRKEAKFPSEGAALPAWLPGVGWSDHWAFWQEGYPGVMVTDTAPFRYQHYHTSMDTPDQLDYGRMARVVAGLEKVVSNLARIPD